MVRKQQSGLGPAFGLVVLAAVAIGLLLWAVKSRQVPEVPPADVPIPMPATNAPPAPPLPAFRHIVFPTDQQALLDTNRPGLFQPTAAGNAQSAMYGSVRTAPHGRGLTASFHEGIDIAPTRRDGAGRPLDSVHAVADGRVAHINGQPGNSNYGNYVVLLHADPVGDVYTLYAHLAAIDPALRVGQPVVAGTRLGLMGHTPTTIIPLARAHTHFEVGVIASTHFDRWFRAQRLKPDHGLYNGWNLLALDPLGFFRMQRDNPTFDFLQYVRTIRPAFEVAVSVPGQLDYFKRYAALWQGPAFAGGTMVLGLSENGAPLSGRAATPDESRRAAGRKGTVLHVDEAVLGRNGARLVVREAGVWRLGQSGERLIDILTYGM